MNTQGIVGLIILAFLGGILLLARKSAVSMPANNIGCSTCGSNIKVTPITNSAHYRNKETRRIEYNDDGLPTLIEITRDYTVA
jgi:hypothetical protein